MTTDELELAIRDSVALEGTRTEKDYRYVVRNVEARHRVEGISPMDLAAWENLKTQHAKRIALLMRA